ncbi:endo alpha-1,4 polygalactosaminidase [Streptomyces sp. NPDC048845]|uniref:endo alpha-1,4 polygalactosaminidase n=1 Tax=Streptomyces sp. NPDC048845 TaxID=3155390 RepID=UPI00342C3500
MSVSRFRSRWWPAVLVAAVAAAAAPFAVDFTAGAAPTAVTLPPAGAPFDYQINGGYTPADEVRVVTRDREDVPAEVPYNICYVNAYQIQPEEIGEWDEDLLLQDADGEVIIDEEWDEALLDISTEEKRKAIAEKVNGWIDGCADTEENGFRFQAVEPDNFDSHLRSGGQFGEEEAIAFARLITDHAHEAGLAVGQKNGAELSAERDRTGFDFAIAEQCGQYTECGEYTEVYGDNVIVIEYSADGLESACDGFGDRLSIVQRDKFVVTDTTDGYVRKTCTDVT